MPARRSKKVRRSTRTPKRRKIVTRGIKGKQKRTTPESVRRSRAAKKGWVTRRKKKKWRKRSRASAEKKKRDKLMDAMIDWRKTALPTRDELYDHLTWAAEEFEVEISEMYRWYWGYRIDDVAE